MNTDNLHINRDFHRNVICLDVQVGSMGFRKSMGVTDITDDKEIDPDFIHVSKDLINRKELTAIRSLDIKFKRTMQNIALPTRIMRGGIFLLSYGMIERAQREVTEYRGTRLWMLQNFLDRYDQIKWEAKMSLGKRYDETQYPPASAIKSKYTVHTSYFMFDVPQGLKAFSEQLFEEERKKSDELWDSARNDIKEGLRLGYAGLVEKMIEKLTPVPGAKQKVFRESLLEDMIGFLDTFEARNLTGDVELEELTKKAKELLIGVSSTQLKVSENVRERVLDGFNQIKDHILTMGIVTRSTRKLGQEQEV